MDDVVLLRRADPGNLGEIELHFFAPDQLIEVNRRQQRAESQTIGLGDVVQIIGRDDGRRAGHVLHQDRRIAGNVLAVVARQNARPQIVTAAGGGADDDANRLALIERRRLRRRRFKVQQGSRVQGLRKRNPSNNPIEPLNP